MYRLYFAEYPTQHIKDGSYVDVNIWSTYKNITDTTKNFMIHILSIDPEQRLTAEEALNDPYFEQNLSITDENDFCAALDEIDSGLKYANDVGIKDVFFNTKKDNKDGKKDNKDDKKDKDDDQKDNDDDDINFDDND